MLSVLFCLSGRVHGAEIIEENDSRYSRKLGRNRCCNREEETAAESVVSSIVIPFLCEFCTRKLQQ